jgi:hypothetical protein
VYKRVIPRDLFNEAKLLKCLGQLSLLIHDGKAPAGLTVTHNGDEFRVSQNSSDGSLMVTSELDFYAGGYRLILSTPLNSRRPYPLTCLHPAADEVEVFQDDGSLTDEFVEFVDMIRQTQKNLRM